MNVHELPMGGCSTATIHNTHLADGSPVCENGTGGPTPTLADRVEAWIGRYDTNEEIYDAAVEEAAAEMPGGIVDDDVQAHYEDEHELLASQARTLLALVAERGLRD